MGDRDLHDRGRGVRKSRTKVGNSRWEERGGGASTPFHAPLEDL